MNKMTGTHPASVLQPRSLPIKCLYRQQQRLGYQAFSQAHSVHGVHVREAVTSYCSSNTVILKNGSMEG